MGFRFAWNDDRTLMRYIAEGDWNWNDYHKIVRASLFSLHNLGHSVDVIIDLRGGSRVPAGAQAHIRSFGKRQQPNLSGRAVVIGLDPAVEAQILGGAESRVLHVDDQTIFFADNDNEALALLR